VVFRSLTEGQGSVLLHLDTGAYHGVNETGATVWALLERDKTFAVLLDELSAMLSRVPVTLEDEIRTFLRDLERRDIIRFAKGAGQP
jgi:hypothetical protein